MDQKKKNTTRRGRIIIIALIVLISLAYFTRPKTSGGGPTLDSMNPFKPKTTSTIKTANMPDATAGEELSPAVKEKMAAGTKPSATTSPAQTTEMAQQTALAALADFDLITNTLGRNDPFAPFYESPKNDIAGEMGGEALPPIDYTPTLPVAPPPPAMTLSGITVAGTSRFAIINGKIMRIGDSIQDYTIKQITDSEVTVVGPFGEKVSLTISNKPVNVSTLMIVGDTITNVAPKPSSLTSTPSDPSRSGQLPIPAPGLMDAILNKR